MFAWMLLFRFRRAHYTIKSIIDSCTFSFSVGLQARIRRRLLKVAEEEVSLYRDAAAYTWPGGCAGIMVSRKGGW